MKNDWIDGKTTLWLVLWLMCWSCESSWHYFTGTPRGSNDNRACQEVKIIEEPRLRNRGGKVIPMLLGSVLTVGRIVNVMESIPGSAYGLVNMVESFVKT